MVNCKFGPIGCEYPKCDCVQAEPVAWGMRDTTTGLILDVICPDEHASFAGDYTVPLYAAPTPAPVPQPVQDLPPLPSQLEALLGVYWQAGYDEGTGHQPEVDPNETLSRIRQEVRDYARASLAATPASTPEGEPTTGQLLMGLAVIREITGTQQQDLEATIEAVRKALAPSPAAPEAWVPYLSDRADGVAGHYAIARWNPTGLGYREVWNPRNHRWSSFSDDVLTLEQANDLLQRLVIPTASLAATPAPAPAKPLTDEQKGDEWRRLVPLSERFTSADWFEAGACFAEQHHRIGQGAATPAPAPDAEQLRLAGLTLIGLAEHDPHCEVFDLDDEGKHQACTCGFDGAIAVITQAGKTAQKESQQ